MLIQKLIDPKKYSLKCPYLMIPKGLCIHNTANDASAENEIAYMQNNGLEVSFHIAVDDKQAIQGIPFNRNTWHAGDGGSGNGNRNYISMEICYSKSGGARFTNAEKRAAKEAAAILKKYNWTVANIRKHQDFSGKKCPHRTIDLGWQRFLNMVQAELNALNQPTPSAPKSTGKIVVGTKVKVIGAKYATGQTVPNWVKANTYKVIQVTGEKALLEGIMSWVYFNDLTVVSGGGTNTPAQPAATYINLKPLRETWAVYNAKGPYTVAHRIGNLAPKKYGGLSYKILGNPVTDVYLIKTESFGTVGIYVPKDNESSFTSQPLY